MPNIVRLAHLRQSYLYATSLLISVYALVLGGSFAGITEIVLRQTSLALLTVFVGVWVLVVMRTPQVGFRQTGQVWSVLWPALLLWGVAYLPGITKTPTSRIVMGTWYAGFYAGIWLILVDLRQRGWLARWILDAILFVSLLLMLIALVEVVGWFPKWWRIKDLPVALVPPRPAVTYGNPNALGTYLAMAIPLGLVRAMMAPRVLSRLVWRVWIGLALLTMYLTYSRGAWLALGAGLVLLLVLMQSEQMRPDSRHFWLRHWRVRKRTAAAGVAAALLLVALMVPSVQSFQTPRRDLGPRYVLYESALKTWLEHPLTGSGAFTYGLRMQEYVSIPPKEPQVNAHNLYLNVAAELGSLGLVALLVTIGLIAYHAWRRLGAQHTHADYAQQAGCCAALAAVGTHSVVDMTVMTPAIMILVLAILAVGLVSERPLPDTDSKSQSRLRTGVYTGVIILLWGVLLTSAWWSTRVYAGYMRGERALVRGEFASGAETLAKAAQKQPEMALYWAEYGYAAGLVASGGDERWLPQGIDAYQRALRLERSHAGWWADLAALLWQSGELTEAVDAMRKAVEYAPDYPDFWLNLGIFYEEQGMIADARAAYVHVLDLKQDWGHAQFWQASEVRREVVAAYPLEPTVYMRAQALVESGDWDEALRVLEASITRDPAQSLPYAQIARLYIVNGKPEQARDYLRAARLLVHTYEGMAWIAYGEALLADALNNEVAYQERLDEARTWLCPDGTGSSWLYGRNVSNFQFLRDKVYGNLLPQLTALGPYPELVDLLREAS